MAHPVSTAPDKRSRILYGVAIGIVAAALFSLTFVLNSVIARGGGAWQWTAVLRYVMTIPIITVIVALYLGAENVSVIYRGFVQRIGFWIVAGSLSCGLFYLGIVYAADHMPGWVVAATWQTTIVASVVVVFLFSKTFSVPRLLTSLVALLGVFLVNWQSSQAAAAPQPLAFIGLLVSAIAYPIGNQLLSIERRRALQANDAVGVMLQNPLVGILMLALGSLPFWAVLLLVSSPGALAPGQLQNVLLTTVFAGVIATALFYYARNLTSNPHNTTAVDSTLSTEVIFAMLMEITFVSAELPSRLQVVGVLLIVLGVAANCFNLTAKQKPRS